MSDIYNSAGRLMDEPDASGYDPELSADDWREVVDQYQAENADLRAQLAKACEDVATLRDNLAKATAAYLLQEERVDQLQWWQREALGILNDLAYDTHDAGDDTYECQFCNGIGANPLFVVHSDECSWEGIGELVEAAERPSGGHRCLTCTTAKAASWMSQPTKRRHPCCSGGKPMIPTDSCSPSRMGSTPVRSALSGLTTSIRCLGMAHGTTLRISCVTIRNSPCA